MNSARTSLRGSWSDVSGNLLHAPVHGVILVNQNIYVATDVGDTRAWHYWAMPSQQPPGPYGGPPYGRPGGPPRGGRSKGLIAAIIVGVAVVLAGGATAAILLLGGDGGGDSDSAAQATAEAFAEAWRDRDCEAAIALVSDRFRETAGECHGDDAFVGEPGDPVIVKESADEATAEMEISDGDRHQTLALQLVHEDGEWLVDRIEGADDPTIGGGSAPPEPPEQPDPHSGELLTVAEDFLAAVRLQDCAGVDALTTEAFKASIDCERELVIPEGYEWSFQEPEIVSADGDMAIVRVVVELEGFQVPVQGTLALQEGRWLVDSLDLSDFPDELPPRH